METEDIIQITIGAFQVGLKGLKEVMAELASTMAGASDEEAAGALIHRLSIKNYIPEKAKPDYARALVREFRKYLGQDLPRDPDESSLVIRVLGQGCANCRTLTQRIMEVLSALNLAADFEHVTDIKEIARYGVLQSPALLINQKLVAVGRIPTKAQLIEWLKKYGIEEESV